MRDLALSIPSALGLLAGALLVGARPAEAVNPPRLEVGAVERLVGSDEPEQAAELETATRAFAADTPPGSVERAIAQAALARLLHLQARFDEAEREHDSLLATLPAALRARPSLHAQLLYNAAETSRAKDDWARAEPLARTALDLRQRQGGAAERADSEVQLAVILIERKSFAEAEPLLRSAAAVRARLLGPGAAKSVNVRAWLARSLHRQKKTAEALPIFTEVMAARRLIDDPVMLGEALADLADARETLGRAAEAEPLRREGVELAGRDRPIETAWARTDLGANLLLQSRWADALAELEPAVTMLAKEGDLSLLDYHQAWVDLAHAQEKLGRWSEALALHRQLVNAIEKERADDPALLANALVGLARNLREGGDAASALPPALRARTLSQGGDRTLRGRVLRELAGIHYTAKEYSEAERAADEALVLAPDKDLARADALMLKGSIAADTRRSREWAKAFAEALAIRKALLPWSDPSVHMLAFDLISAQQNLTQWAEAEGVAREAVEALAGLPDKAPYLRALSRLATLLLNQQRLDDAEVTYRVLLAETEGRPGTDNAIQAANAWAGIAQVAERHSSLTAAEQAFQRALGLWGALEQGPNQQRNIAGISTRLANTLIKAGKFREAEIVLRDARERFSRIDGADDANAAWTTWLLADTLAALRRSAEADILYREAIAVMRKDEAPVRAIPALTGHGRLALRQLNEPALALTRLREAVSLALSAVGQATGDEARRDLLRNREIFQLSVEAAWAAQHEAGAGR